MKVKNNWQTKKLGDLCQIEIGKTPYRGNPKYWDKEKENQNIWLSIADLLNTKGNIVSDSKEYISNDGAKISKIVKEDTLLASFKLTLGRLAFAGKDLYTNEAIAALNIKNDKEISKKYLYQYLSFFDWYGGTDEDVKIKGRTLNKAKLREIVISFPESIEEQEKIVKKLNEVFENIEKAKNNVEKNLQNSHDLFESYLQNIFSNPGSNWKEKKIIDIVKVVNGYSFRSNDFSSTNLVKSVKITNVGVKEFIEETDNYLPEKYKETLKDFQVREGNIVVALTRTIIKAGLKVAVVPKSYDGALINQRVAALISDARMINQRYLYNYLCSEAVAKYVKSKVNTLMQPNLSLNDLKNLIVPCPSLSEQEEIIKKLDELSEQTKKLEQIYKQKLVDLGALKKSILNEVFAGKL